MSNSPYRTAHIKSQPICTNCGAPLPDRPGADSAEQQGTRCQVCFEVQHDLLAFFDMVALGASVITGSLVFLAEALAIHVLVAYGLHRFANDALDRGLAPAAPKGARVAVVCCSAGDNYS